MSPVIPFDIIARIVDIVGENEDNDLLKELSLVSHSFLQICSKHLFATIALDDARLSSKRGFVMLLKSRPEVVQYIRKLTYKFYDNNLSFGRNDRLLSSTLPNFLRSIPHLNYLKITSRSVVTNPDWKELDPSVTSALLHLMHLPTINHIEISYIQNFPISSLIPCVNLLRLDVNHLRHDDDSFEIVPSEVMPKLREFRTTKSSLLTRKLLHAKLQDGRPAFNLMNLRRLSLFPEDFEDKSSIRYLLQNAKLLEELHWQLMNVLRIVGLRDSLSPTACTLKVLRLKTVFYSYDNVSSPTRLYEELEAMAGHNVLEALTIEIWMSDSRSKDCIGTIIQKVGEILVKPGWSALRQVFFKVACLSTDSAKVEALRSLINEKYLGHFSALESVAFNYSVDVFLA